MTGESRAARAARLYAQGYTTRQVGARLEASDRTIARWVGADIRRRGPRGRTDVPDDLIVRLRDEESLPYEVIAEDVGMSKTGVRKRYARITGSPSG